jgi:4-amino-4-deoxy-L-arabinose transferase-like glycosyltransferase
VIQFSLRCVSTQPRTASSAKNESTIAATTAIQRAALDVFSAMIFARMREMDRLKTTAQLLGLFSFCLGLHLCGTWAFPLMDRDEPRFAEAAREMRESGDWVVPTFNGKPRYDKPPLTYWLQIGALKIFGENEFAARFHAPLCAALTALVVFGFCESLYGRAAAWHAAIAFTVCLQLLVSGKAAIADMPMLLCVTLAAWAGWELLKRPGGFWRTIFFAALAVGFLAKGPVAWLPLIWIFVYAKWAGVTGFAGRFRFLRGTVPMLGIVALWAVPACWKTHGEFFTVGLGRHVIARSFAPLEGHGGRGWALYLALFPFYSVTVFASFFPWAIWLPATVRRLRQKRAQADVYLLGGVLTTFVVFSIVATKLPHYTLPAFPLLACLVAPHLAQSRTAFYIATVGMVVLNLGLSFCAPSFLGPSVAQAALATLPANLPQTTRFASVEFDEPSLVWYFRSRFKTAHELIAPDAFNDFIRGPGARVCLVPDEIAASLPDAARVSGWNLAKGRRVALRVLRKDD